ncbi:rCG63072 [Rattus norvegicus]|uniref:RCG63072 n=1 Tax=Rattus norvegicus TaxID=10116 RepID=A6KPL4_RAT|nr:rCG63072 [Rattus norvegicus]
MTFQTRESSVSTRGSVFILGVYPPMPHQLDK